MTLEQVPPPRRPCLRSYFWTGAKAELPSDVVDDFRGLALSADGTVAVFDVPVGRLAALEEAAARPGSRFSVATALPPLKSQPAPLGGGGGAGGGGYQAGGGRGFGGGRGRGFSGRGGGRGGGGGFRAAAGMPRGGHGGSAATGRGGFAGGRGAGRGLGHGNF